ncbi:MAG TPA: zf-TFIIB domain-containing protein [Thermomicrobiales bacterium]|nr:zf-TFIIB domain-containing protein [Thermomicrobiales bacterium]
MKCPIDQSDLMMTERNGVEIDYCPKCRGVWLDRGELDKIIERDSAAAPIRTETRASSVQTDRNARDTPPVATWDDDDDDRYPQGKKKKRRGSFLEDLFDF